MIKKNTVYIKVINGLANRLRTLCSFHKFCELNDCFLRVCWEKSAGWSNEKFYDLFENKIQLISEDEYNDVSKNNFCLEKVIKKCPDNQNLYTQETNLENILEKIYFSSFCYNGDSCLEYMIPKYFYSYVDLYQKNDFINKLIIKKEIKKVIEKYKQRIHRNTIGVHVRRGDAWTSPWSYEYEISDDKSFMKIMDKEIDINPRVNFFLATDCKATEDLFKYIYKDRVISYEEKNFFDSIDHTKPKPYQKDALIDMALLSSTSKIIGSYWSSFSYMSSRMGKIPLVIAKKC